VTVIRPGLFTTVQDGGRWGRQQSGFPVSGALDRVSHALANRAVGNAPEAGALEITLAGPELRLEQPTLVAVSGAELAASLDGHPVEVLTPIEASAGSMLRFGNRTRGARAYVAFAGGVTSLRRWPVRPLAAGQVLPLNSAVPATRGVVHARPALPNGGARLRVMRGPQDDQLPADAFDILVRSRFTISPQSNRIGFRLSGPAVPAAPGAMISDATFPGGVQIPPSGEPILLMADRQTTGGYPQLAVVITADLPVAGQLLPGDWVEFVPTTRAEAIEALTAQDAMVRDAR
jgi:antagonist of KipI